MTNFARPEQTHPFAPGDRAPSPPPVASPLLPPNSATAGRFAEQTSSPAGSDTSAVQPTVFAERTASAARSDSSATHPAVFAERTPTSDTTSPPYTADRPNSSASSTPVFAEQTPQSRAAPHPPDPTPSTAPPPAPPRPPIRDRWIGTTHAKRLVGVGSENTIKNWAYRGYLRARRLPNGRIQVLQSEVIRLASQSPTL